MKITGSSKAGVFSFFLPFLLFLEQLGFEFISQRDIANYAFRDETEEILRDLIMSVYPFNIDSSDTISSV